jgi:hypothetical protein
MSESEKLAKEGLRILAVQGWPEDKAEEIMDLFMRAGMHYWQEQMDRANERNMRLIEKVTVN